MKTIKKFYAHFIFLGFVLFSLTGAYYSTPMLPDVEIEFKASIQNDYHNPSPLYHPSENLSWIFDPKK